MSRLLLFLVIAGFLVAFAVSHRNHRERVCPPAPYVSASCPPAVPVADALSGLRVGATR